ncbi:MAG: 5'-nucleotidase C-terminal domain-containing protein [Flavobacteriaceae bacterium]|nr:5'-nucleotidase C-terminal domain-containing protein [Bacteroidia bacterium]NNK88455.1 5'-nucleotidase C-terminal domain-containing protein [Flavobacteriaceae bacterium]
MNYKQFMCFLGLFVLISCRPAKQLYRIEGNRLEINDSLSIVREIDGFIKPYREHLNASLDSVISYSADLYSKTDGELNTAIGNMMADLVYEQANPIFKSRTGKVIDMVLLNHGGIRAILPEGPITTREAFEIMPFENSIVVVEMKGSIIDSMINYLRLAKRAHPINGLKLKLNPEYEVLEATISGSPITEDKIYSVATNDYLYYGGDRMNFFKLGDSLHTLNYKIRDAMIDYFSRTDTIQPVIDDRFIIEKINK